MNFYGTFYRSNVENAEDQSMNVSRNVRQIRVFILNLERVKVINNAKI